MAISVSDPGFLRRSKEALIRRSLERDHADDPDRYTFHTELTQAERIIHKFGGARELARLFAACGCPRDPATIYKWTYNSGPNRKDGTNGLIPTQAWPDLFRVARYSGVMITAEDMDPRPTLVKIKRERESYVSKKSDPQPVSPEVTPSPPPTDEIFE